MTINRFKLVLDPQEYDLFIKVPRSSSDLIPSSLGRVSIPHLFGIALLLCGEHRKGILELVLLLSQLSFPVFSLPPEVVGLVLFEALSRSSS